MVSAANSLSRALTLINLFDGPESVWTIEEMAESLDTSVRTVYRDVSALKDAGFLDPAGNGGYTLGPAFVHFDWLLRRTDPLISSAIAPMRVLLQNTREDATAVLCRRYRDCVMCVHQEHGTAPHRDPVYQRGVTVPLFVGATSKVVLASLPSRTLKQIYLENEAQIKATSRCVDWKSFNSELSRIRANRHALTVSELRDGSVGIASPILREDQVLGCVALVFDAESVDTDERYQRLIARVIVCADAISQSLSNGAVKAG